MKERESHKAQMKEAEQDKDDLNHNSESLKETDKSYQKSEKMENVIKDDTKEKKVHDDEKDQDQDQVDGSVRASDVTKLGTGGEVESSSDNINGNIRLESDELTNFYSE